LGFIDYWQQSWKLLLLFFQSVLCYYDSFLNMAPLQPPQNFEVDCLFYQIDALNVASSSNQPPNPIPSNFEPFFNVDMWIYVENTTRKWKGFSSISSIYHPQKDNS